MKKYQKEPFFLVGSVRSGTTLLRLLLGHHPDICRCEEMDYVTPALHGHASLPEAASYREFLMRHRGFRLSGYSVDTGLTFEQLARSFLKQRHEIDRRRLVGAAVHHHFDELHRVWPDARYIFLQRDPRDVARSCVAMGWAGTAWAGATSWIAAQEALARLYEKLPEDRILEVYFEKLVAEPIEVLERICQFLGTRFDPAMLEIDSDTTYSRPNPYQAKSWRKSASPREIAEVEARVGMQGLERANYPASGVPTLSLGPVTRLELFIKDVFFRVRFRQRRYGFKLWLAGVLSRRLPVRPWRDKVQLQIDAIDNKHLK